MKLINLHPTPILNTTEEESKEIKSMTDQTGHLCYRLISEATNMFPLTYNSLINTPYKYIDLLHLFPFNIDADNFNNYLEEQGKEKIENSIFCLYSSIYLYKSLSQTLYYMDKETKDDLIRYMRIRLKYYKEKLENLKNQPEIDQEKAKSLYSDRIQDIKTTINNLKYYYDRKMLLFYIH